MPGSRVRLAPGQSRVSTASAFGRIGFLLAAAVLTIPKEPPKLVTWNAPHTVPAGTVVVPGNARVACLVVSAKSGRCATSYAHTASTG